MKTTRRRRRFGRVVFFIPLAVLLVAAVYVILTSVSFTPGTLIVTAQTSGKYYSPINLNVTADVGTRTGLTPFHLLLTPGTYTVQFPQEPWLYTPPGETVHVPGGQVSYVVGVFNPIVREVLVRNSQFNTTAVTAMHLLTPLIFVNKMNVVVQLQVDSSHSYRIPPSGNLTYVYPVKGVFPVSLLGVVGTPTVTVTVS